MVQYVNDGFSASPVQIPPTPAAVDPELHDLVINGWTEAHDFAKAAYDAAIAYLQSLQNATNAIGNIPPIDTNLPVINPDLTQIQLDPTALQALVEACPVTPNNTTVFTEIPYTSAYLNDLRATLDQWVTGTNTGLPPDVELAIWNRGREREMAQFNLKSAAAIRSFAMRGFAKPPGALSIELQDAAQVMQDASSTLSRDVMVKQADLEQTNRRFAFEQAWKAEEGLIQYTNQQMTRALDYVKTLQTFITTVFSDEVRRFGVQEQIYTTQINSKVGMFKAEIDAAVAEANVRIEAAKANIQLMIQEATLLIETIKAGAQVAAQLAASSLSAVSLQGAIHSSTQTTAANSTSNDARVDNSFQVSDSDSNQKNWSGQIPSNMPVPP